MTEPLSLSVIVPTLDEAANLPGCLASVRRQEGCAQVIVADGGSNDGTRQLARRLGAEVVASAPGRGLQIHAGLQSARGTVVLVLHADCRLTPGATARIRAVLRADPRVVGGAMRMCFDGGGRRQRLIAGLNNLRTRVSGIAFGDQGQFFRPAALDRAGGFPAQMLMEDVELSLRLNRAGRVLLLPGGIRASARSWHREGFAGRLALVLGLCGRYLLDRARGIDPGRAERYYRRYYGHGPPPRA